MTKNPTWTVNQYHASACVKTVEINRKMLEVYNSSDDFPKSWHSEDTRVSTKGKNKGKPSPRWKIEAGLISAPNVSFATDIANGVNLNTTVLQGNFAHLVVDMDADPPSVDWEKLDLHDYVFRLQTNVQGIEHYAPTGGTIDDKLTVQSLYADLDNPKYISDVDTGYELTDDSIDFLTNNSAHKISAEDLAVLVTTTIKNKPYPTADAFWRALVDDLGPRIVGLADSKANIILAAHGSFDAPDDTMRSIAVVLYDMMRSPNYKKQYVFGKVKIPHVEATKGPFTPRSMRFSRYQNADDTTIGSLNWNLMVSEKPPLAGKKIPLPDLTKHANAGSFDEMPIPKDAPGVMIVSHGKVIEELILPKAFTKMGINLADFTADIPNCKATLNKDVALNTKGLSHINSGTFTANNTVITPDPANNRYKIDFLCDNVEFDRKFKDYLSWNVLSIILKAAHTPSYKATWSGYITFGLKEKVDKKTGRKTQVLKAGYTHSEPDISYSTDDTAWHVIRDIASLGTDELHRLTQMDEVTDDLEDYVDSSSGAVLTNILDCVELPGEAVFDFKELDLYYLGLRVHLKYE